MTVLVGIKYLFYKHYTCEDAYTCWRLLKKGSKDQEITTDSGSVIIKEWSMSCIFNLIQSNVEKNEQSIRKKSLDTIPYWLIHYFTFKYMHCDTIWEIDWSKRHQRRLLRWCFFLISNAYKISMWLRRKPLVSVVMPVYNTEKYLSEAIESILAQTFVDFEFIIIDDGSTDRSWEIIEEYAKKDDRIRVFQNRENRWISFTRNRLIELSTTKYIASQDSDDISYPHRLSVSYEFLISHDTYGVVSWDNCIIDEEWKYIWKRIYSDDIEYTILKKSPISQPSSMFRLDIFTYVWWYDPWLNYGEDYDLRCKMYAHWYGIKNVGDSLIKHRVRNGQTKSTFLKETLRNTMYLQKRAAVEYWIDVTYSDRLYRLTERILLLFPSELIMRCFKKLTYHV